MITKTDTVKLLRENLQRTDMLIAAMEKINAYNRIYQMKQPSLQEYKIVKNIQDEELASIEKSCGEHAIISLATTIETYYKEITQQLLADYPKYFISRQTKHSIQVTALIKSRTSFNYENIEDKLNLTSRFRYYDFLKAYSLTLFTEDEKKIVEYVFLRRNNYVHNAGRVDKKFAKGLLKTPPPFTKAVTKTEAKKLRTKLSKTLFQSFERVTSLANIG